MGSEVSLYHTFNLALRQLETLYAQTIEPLNLNVLEWHVLQVLYQQDEQHASTLAKAVGRQVTSFTPVLDKLAREGWIVRQPDLSDRRAVLICLTPKAEAQREAMQGQARAIEEQLQKLISQEDRQVLERIVESLQDQNKK